MAMTILNNSAANMTLGELNKNINKVGKQLTKVATGQKIVGASDNSSAYAISEKMREQIRSLEQDIQNVQNGSSMLKIAHGGIENIVEELRSLKELSINAANDSNTDADRQIMQKEFDQRRATIDEIASWTNYNGKTLIDGTYENKLRVISNSNNSGSSISNTMAGAFSLGSPNSQYSTNKRSWYMDPVSRQYLIGHVSFNGYGSYYGSYGSSKPWTNNPLPSLRWSNSEEADEDGYSYYNVVGYSSDIAVKMDFTRYTNGLTNAKLRDFLNGKGFSILCGGCDQYINVKFDSSIANTESTRGEPSISEEDSEENSAIYVTSGSIEYTIGISGLKNGKEVSKFIYDAVKTINTEEGYVASLPSGTEATRLDARHNVNLLKMDGNYYVTKNSAPDLIIYNGLVGGSSSGGQAPEVSYEVIRQNPLVIHHGTKANQAIKVYLNDMHTKSLKGDDFPSEADVARMNSMDYNSTEYTQFVDVMMEASEKTLADASVTTRRDANVSIRIIDGAIDYALGEATRVGAYLQRLEYTEANVTAQDENTQGAESTIRDADMAKEMTEYTKQNVLSQAAQSMLAQANQNMSSVLSLLQ